MSIELLRRPPRALAPPHPSGELAVAAPPADLAKAGGTNPFQMLMPVLGSAGGLAMMLANPSPLLVLSGGLMAGLGVISGVGMALTQRTAGRRRTVETRRRYSSHLVDLRRRLQVAARDQAATAAWRHPRPEALWAIAAERTRLWERRPGDADFLELRAGTGRVPLALRPRVESSRDPMRQDDQICAAAAQRLVRRWDHLDDQPLALPLRRAGIIVVRGPRSRTMPLLRAVVVQACAFHSPQDLQLAIAARPDRLEHWAWCKWLPHTEDAELGDGAGAGRLLAGSYEQFELVAHQEVAARKGSRAGTAGRLLVVIDGLSDDQELRELLQSAPGTPITVLHVLEHQGQEPEAVDVRVVVDPEGSLAITSTDPPPVVPAGTPSAGTPEARELHLDGVADALSEGAATAFARVTAAVRLSADAAGSALGGTVDVQTLLGLGDAATFDVPQGWRHRPLPDFLNVPFGVGPRGEPVRLDLKEAALGGHGPHGLLIGATGSGKSELLRALLIALVTSHPPDLFSMVLVDFKGGAAFAGLAPLPHVAGMITNLSDDLVMVDRMRDALIGEQRRRQEMLAKTGNLANIREYQALRARRPELEPMPNLLVVIDEFSELLSERPEMIDTFVAIGRLGRSLGVHLLFSSQRLEEGKLRGLDSHLSYRLGLRMFSAGESRTVLGVTDAYELPPIPGSGYLKVDTTVWQRYKAAFVSGPYVPPAAVADQRRPRPDRFTATTRVEPASVAREARPEESTGPSVLDVIVDRLRAAAPRCHQVWVPPLRPAVPLDALLGPVGAHERRGLVAFQWPGVGRLQIPLGLVDRPLHQRTDILVQDLSGPAGHVAVVGAPQSGKSTLLRSLVASLALTHAPTEVQVHVLDLGGGGFGSMAGLPHLGTVAGRMDPQLVRRIVAEVHAVLAKREALFNAERIDSMADYRARRAAGQLVGERYGDLFLVIDGWTAFKQGFDDLEQPVVEIAQRGLGYGVHVAISASRWLDVRPQLKDAVGARYELRLNDPLDSEIDRKMSKLVAGAPAGRGLTREKLLCQFALPRIDGEPDPAGLGKGIEHLVKATTEAWPHEGAHQVRTLPEVVKADDLLGLDAEGRGVVIGLSEADLLPLRLDLLGNEPNLVVLGESESGKSSFLRAFAQQLVAAVPPEDAQILVVDYRRSLLEVVATSHLRGYAGSAPATVTEIGRLREELVARLPGADLTPAQLRSRSWWAGPEVYVIVDDYDIVVSPSGNPLQPLLELLPQARDVGLHVLLARRSAGVSRALFEPVLQRLRELGAQHLLLSGDPGEGAVAGPHRLAARNPGRGLLVRRAGATITQTIWVPEPDFY